MFVPARILTVAALLAANAVCHAQHSGSNPFHDSTFGNSSSDKNKPENCLTVAEARKHVGKKNCVKGTVVRVEEGHNGVTFLDFCADFHSCPFTVVVFRADLQSLGDVRQLQGRELTIMGTIDQYDDRAEIILRHPQQLGDSASRLTALPKDYDVEHQGHYSAGTFRASKAKKPKHQVPGASLSLEDPEVP